MEKNQSVSQRIYQAFGAILGWLAVIGQFYLMILNRTTPVGETIIRFFSFFTILTNILVALCFTACWLNKGSWALGFFARPATLAATTVYITVVGGVYNTILRFLWQPAGWQWVINELLHAIIPLLFILFWLLFVQKEGLTWKGIRGWLIYPLLYVVFIVIRGASSGFYPYPFIDVTALGYPRSLLNTALLIFLFLLLSMIVVAIGRQMSKRNV